MSKGVEGLDIGRFIKINNSKEETVKEEGSRNVQMIMIIKLIILMLIALLAVR